MVRRWTTLGVLRWIAVGCLGTAALGMFAAAAIGSFASLAPNSSRDVRDAPYFPDDMFKSIHETSQYSLHGSLVRGTVHLTCYEKQCVRCGCYPPYHAWDCFFAQGVADYSFAPAHIERRVTLPGISWQAASGITSRFSELEVSLWLAGVVFGVYPALAIVRGPIRRHRRKRRGGCLKCGYDLTGNVSGRCPECGTER